MSSKSSKWNFSLHLQTPSFYKQGSGIQEVGGGGLFHNFSGDYVKLISVVNYYSWG